MGIQTRANFKKEFLAFFRANRFTILAATVIAIALLSPLLITGLGAMMTAMSDIYDEMGMDVTGMTDMLGSHSSIGVMSSVSDLTTTALIVFLLLINRHAGGEQKKRAVIIPRSSGLRSFSYIFPKFIIYPLSAFALGFAGMIASWFVSGLLFQVHDVIFSVVAIAGALVGVCLMLYVCFHLAFGTATGRPGLSATFCIIASFILPHAIALADADLVFNPFALPLMASEAISNGFVTFSQGEDMAVTVSVAFGIMLLTYFIALFAQNAKRIDNRGNEINL